MKKEPRYWLLKSEGETYSIDTLRRDEKTPWSGVRNFQARNFMRDEMRMGDRCLFYHTGKEKGIVGIAKVASAPYPDPTQFDRKSPYFDAKSKKENPTWILVDIAFVRKFKQPIPLPELKRDPALSDMALFRAPRLSIQPVSPAQFAHIQKLAA